MSNTEYVPEEEWKELTKKDRVELDKPLNKWIVAKNPDYSGGGYYRCPVCNYEYSWGAFFELDEYEYCPKCGALLNGKTKANDHISRQAAIDACLDGWNNTVDDCLRNIRNLPSTDVVEVVRCKDCKHSEHWYRDKARCFLWYEDGIDVWEDGFCNYGERGTDGEILY